MSSRAPSWHAEFLISAGSAATYRNDVPESSTASTHSDFYTVCRMVSHDSILYRHYSYQIYAHFTYISKVEIAKPLGLAGVGSNVIKFVQNFNPSMPSSLQKIPLSSAISNSSAATPTLHPKRWAAS